MACCQTFCQASNITLLYSYSVWSTLHYNALLYKAWRCTASICTVWWIVMLIISFLTGNLTKSVKSFYFPIWILLDRMYCWGHFPFLISLFIAFSLTLFLFHNWLIFYLFSFCILFYFLLSFFLSMKCEHQSTDQVRSYYKKVCNLLHRLRPTIHKTNKHTQTHKQKHKQIYKQKY